MTIPTQQRLTTQELIDMLEDRNGANHPFLYTLKRRESYPVYSGQNSRYHSIEMHIDARRVEYAATTVWHQLSAEEAKNVRDAGAPLLVFSLGDGYTVAADFRPGDTAGVGRVERIAYSYRHGQCEVHRGNVNFNDAADFTSGEGDEWQTEGHYVSMAFYTPVL